MRTRDRRHRTTFGPLAFNFSGLELTSVTLKLPLWRSLVLWERRSR